MQDTIWFSYSLELDMLGLAGPVVAGHVGVILTVALQHRAGDVQGGKATNLCNKLL